MLLKNLNLSPQIEKQIKEIVDFLEHIFEKDLLGVYLYGSAVVGGLQKYSDIDLFIVLNRASTHLEKIRLVKKLLDLSGIYMHGIERSIELTMVEKNAVNPWKFPPIFDFQYGEWLRDNFEKGNIDPWPNKQMPDLALLITQLFLSSITLIGDQPKKLLSKVPYCDFISAITDELPNLTSELDDDTRNILLALARIWATVFTNKIYSKPDAAHWGIIHLPIEYKAVLQRAKDICEGVYEEYWNDLKHLIKPCADFMLTQINRQLSIIKLSADFDKTIELNLV